MRVLFPWPDKRLSPNARLHWARLAEAKAAAREAAAWDVKAQVPHATLIAVAQGDARIPMTITFYPPDARRRDDDNMVGSFKAIRDGLADALGVDDRRFQPHYFFADPCKPGFVEVFIHENGAETALPQGDDSAMENAAQGSASTLLLGLNIKPEKEAPMSLTPDRRILSAAQSKIPVVRFDERRARDAYDAHIALIDQEQRQPSLKGNPAWQLLRADAYENFTLAFGGVA